MSFLFRKKKAKIDRTHEYNMKNLQLEHEKNIERELKKYNEEVEKLKKNKNYNKKKQYNNNHNINNDVYAVEYGNNWRERDRRREEEDRRRDELDRRREEEDRRRDEDDEDDRRRNREERRIKEEEERRRREEEDIRRDEEARRQREEEEKKIKEQDIIDWKENINQKYDKNINNFPQKSFDIYNIDNNKNIITTQEIGTFQQVNPYNNDENMLNSQSNLKIQYN